MGAQHVARVTELRGLLKLAHEKLSPADFGELQEAMKAAYPRALGRGPDGVVRFGPAIGDITRIIAPKPVAPATSPTSQEPVVDPDDLPFE
jgi:hypothetical protein